MALQYLAGGAQEDHDNPKSGYLVSGPRSELYTSPVQAYGVNATPNFLEHNVLINVKYSSERRKSISVLLGAFSKSTK